MPHRTVVVPALLLFLLVGACAPAFDVGTAPAPAAAEELWRNAHAAHYRGEIEAAEQTFLTLFREHPETRHGREALFFAGLTRLDPHHESWSPERAAERLEQYLDEDETGPRAARTPEARSALALANQFRMPPESRIEPLRPTIRTVTIDAELPATDEGLREEVERLRQRVAERDRTIREQQAELERIRRALVPDD